MRFVDPLCKCFTLQLTCILKDTNHRRRVALENKAVDILEEKQRQAEEARKAEWAATLAARREEEETRRARRREREATGLGRSTLRYTGLAAVAPPDGASLASFGPGDDAGPAVSTRSGAPSASFRSSSTWSARTPSSSALRSSGTLLHAASFLCCTTIKHFLFQLRVVCQYGPE